ncbi:hypothetical protein LY76DRAFT_343631 [Colletotrichum caudatum]|nr:hypothetical protein LY76DRAFT_343631 [Colletotrichum caudatum]
MERFVVSSSKGVAETTKTRIETVQFIHESARDLLVKNRGLQELWPALREDFQCFSHGKLHQCCLSQTTLDMSTEIPVTEPFPKANSDQGQRLRETASEKFPFVEYVIGHVFYHANATSGISRNDLLSRFPVSTWLRLSNIFEKHHIRCYTPALGITYILADRNYVHILTESIQQYQDAFTFGVSERYGSPSFAALANGH